jgi:predicted regulator of Ras-like GTPase activity (Roadblock/LC7/MglB family)
MSDRYAAATHSVDPRSARLERVLTTLLAQAPELEAAAVVSFDGLPMASALPSDMDEDRVAAMSAALLSLGERAAQGLGRGDLSQVYVEGETGTVFLVSADDEAVLVAVGAQGAKVGLLLFEVRQAAAAVGETLRRESDLAPVEEPAPATEVGDLYDDAAPDVTDEADELVPELGFELEPQVEDLGSEYQVEPPAEDFEPEYPFEPHPDDAEPVPAGHLASSDSDGFDRSDDRSGFGPLHRPPRASLPTTWS